jgi:uncharacterized phage infection (PIP) family protein YhgE
MPATMPDTLVQKIEQNITLRPSDTPEFHDAYLRYTRLNNEYMIDYIDTAHNKIYQYMDESVNRLHDQLLAFKKSDGELSKNVTNLHDYVAQSQDSFEQIDSYIKSSSEEIVALGTALESLRAQMADLPTQQAASQPALPVEDHSATLTIFAEQITQMQAQISKLNVAQAQSTLQRESSPYTTPPKKANIEILSRDFHVTDFLLGGFMMAVIFLLIH